MPRNHPQPTEFSECLRRRRLQLGISLPELERRTGIHNARLSRWERGLERPSHPDRIPLLAKGLDLPLADLYSLAGVEMPGLPALRLYLRSKYGTAMPPEALDDIARYGEDIARRYGTSTGPGLGEDE